MRYQSTRGKAPTLSFEEVLLTGLASDGGLYIPESFPFFSPEEISAWQGLPYNELAFHIMYPFVEGDISAEDFKSMIDETYAISTFRHRAVSPLVQVDNNHWILELFHGPTLAFKDFALQLLGRLLDHVLQKRGQKAIIVGATSGDTGSAAIEGCKACRNVDMVILHPHGRVSEVQRRQMTTVISDNIHNIALDGSFDDCQNIVKSLFMDQSFLQGTRQLIAVNSINWARIMAQIVYYFYTALHLGGPARTINFSVPTGNFGDIFAGYLARKMGLPIDQLVIATNRNDILHRFLTNNDYSAQAPHHTLSPSMDIVISSNFERLLFDIHDRDAATIDRLMSAFSEGHPITIETHRLAKIRALFASHAVDDETICEMIRTTHQRTGYLLDPHTAIGLKAAYEKQWDSSQPMVTLATAHPAKFAEAIDTAGMTQYHPALPAHLEDLLTRKEAYHRLPKPLASVTEFITNHIMTEKEKAV